MPSLLWWLHHKEGDKLDPSDCYGWDCEVCGPDTGQLATFWDRPNSLSDSCRVANLDPGLLLAAPREGFEAH